MKFLKKHWKNILFVLFMLILLLPVTRKPIQIAIHKLIAFSPSVVAEENQEQLSTYNWQLQDTQGELHTFKKSKNRVVLINFWATWCPPCIAEMPDLQALYDDYGKQVDFYFITNDEPERIDAFFAKHAYNLPVYYSTSSLPKPLNGYSLPTTYVLDKKGNIVIEKTGTANWNGEKMRNLLDSLLK